MLQMRVVLCGAFVFVWFSRFCSSSNSWYVDIDLLFVLILTIPMNILMSKGVLHRCTSSVEPAANSTLVDAFHSDVGLEEGEY